jgi:predicted TIM-barrel fold metal-dependent hydrolase
MTEAITAGDRYIVITSDGHAGANMKTYREYLEPKWREEFDAWRGGYRNPFRDLQGDTRYRNWDSERRNAEMADDGIVGEVVFPNTVPPFFPTGALIAPQPTKADYERRLIGIRAHNRWLADWCAEHPHMRAGIAQIFLNDIDDAIEDVTFAKEHGLRGGILLPGVPPDNPDILPLYAPDYDRLWAVCQDLDVVVNHHGGGGGPSYGSFPASQLIMYMEVPTFSRRALVHLLMSGVFERFPRMKLALTEMGGAWVGPLLEQLDRSYDRITRAGRAGELGFGPDKLPRLKPSEYFMRQVWMGVSFPTRAEADSRHVFPADRFMWGSDYPHNEGTYPYSKEAIRLAFSGLDADTVRPLLADNVAALYDFDLAELAPMAATCGPLISEIFEPLDHMPSDASSPAFLVT